MTTGELVRATNLASSIRKTQGLERDQNRGEGAKVAALPWNHAGLRLRSCCEGVVSGVILARVNDIYGRRRYPVVDDNDVVVSYDSAWDVTEDAKAENYPTDHDWTEVVCIGRQLHQDTTRWPYGEGRGAGTRREVLTEIFDRFYSVPALVKLEADESLHGRKGSMVFRLMKDVIAKWGNDHSKLRFERVPIRDGIEIEFVHTPMLSGNNTVMGAHELTGQSTRVSLVWNGEMYDPHIGPNWRRIAAGFGLPHVHSEVSVFVHLPNDAPVRCGPYRVDLMSKETGEALEVEDFQTEIRMAMPDWIRRLVSDALQPRQVSDMSAVRRELERRLREARIRPADLNRPGASPPSKPMLGSGARFITMLQTGSGGGTGSRSTGDQLPTVLDPDAPTGYSGGGTRSGQQEGLVKRRRSIQTVTSAPEISWLDSQGQIEGEELTDRAGKYDAATNTLFLNGLYVALQAKIASLETQYAQQVDWEQVRKLVVDKVRAAMALHIGSIVVYALAKQGRPAWTEAQWKAAFTPESLTVAADQSEHLLGEIRSALVATGAFKAARAV